MLIRIAVFTSGAVLLALEIVALWVMPTRFGGAHHQVSTLIAAFLGAMSVGYWLGGRWGDRFPRPLTLVCTMGGSSVLVALVPIIEPPLADMIFNSRLPLETHALIWTVLVYFLPVLLLATASPIAIRLMAKSVAETGTTAGGISALSTVGSIVGALVTGFYLVNVLQIPNIVYSLGGVMMVMTVLVGGVYRTQTLKAALVLACVAAFAVEASAQRRVLFERQTPYHHIIVAEENGVRWLHFDNTFQSSMDPNDPMKGFLEYTDYFHCAFLFNPNIKEVLFVGLGGASGPKRFLYDYPEVNVDVVEIDPVVVQVAKTYFGLKDDPRLKIYTMDGRIYIKRTKKQYDLIVLDAYAANRYGLSVPRHLTTKEFLEEVSDRLNPNGIMVYNIAADFTNYASRMTRAMHRTAAAVFPALYSWDVETSMNTVLVALKSPQKVTKAQLVAHARTLVQQDKVKLPDFVRRVSQLHTARYRTDDVPLLTDNYAPVDSLMRGR